jgi:hypothetical protein
MSHPLLEHGISLIGEFVPIVEIVWKKLKANYPTAEIALRDIVERVLKANSTMVKWSFDFEALDLSSETKNSFDKFRADFRAFRQGPDYGNLLPSCREISRLYDGKIKLPLDKLFSGDELAKTKKIFDMMSHSDAEMAYLCEFLIEKSLEPIIEKINNDYTNAKTIQKEYVKSTKQVIDRLKSHTDKLRMLRDKFSQN